jgi:tape measure domain-containing protein
MAAIRNLEIEITVKSEQATDRVKEISKEVSDATKKFESFGHAADASLDDMSKAFYDLGAKTRFDEISKASGLTASQIEKLVDKARKDIGLDAEFLKAARAAGLTDDEIRRVKGSIDKVKESAVSWQNVMAGISAIGIGYMATQFVKDGVKMAAQSEDMSIQFEVLMGDAEKAKNTIADLQKFTAQTPFESDEVIKAGRQLLAVNVPAEELIDNLRMIGDVSKGSGKDFNELATIMAKNKSSNFIQGEDLNQLIEAGIPILDEFSKMFGKSASEIKKMGSQGKIEYKHLQQAFKNLTGEHGKYENMMGRLSTTSAGLWSTVSDNIKQINKGFGTVILDVFKPALAFFADSERGSARLTFAITVLSAALIVGLVGALSLVETTTWIAMKSAIKMWAAFLGPIAFIVAGLALLYIVLEDVYTFFEYGADGSDTFFGDFLKWVGLSDQELQQLKFAFQDLKIGLTDLWEKFKEFFSSDTGKMIFKVLGIITLIGLAFIFWPVTLAAVLITIGTIMYTKWGAITKWFSDLWNVIWKSIRIGFIAVVEFIKKAAIIAGKILLTFLFPVAGLYFFKDEISAVFDWLWKKISDIPFIQVLVDKFYSLKNTIGQAMSSMWETVRSSMVNLLPTGILNSVIDSINYAMGKLKSFSEYAHSKYDGIPVIEFTPIAHIEAREMGGPVSAGRPYLVGERGPELVIPENNGTVIPNNQLNTATESRGTERQGSTIVFNASFTIMGGNAEESAMGVWEKLKQLAKDNQNEMFVELGMSPVYE